MRRWKRPAAIGLIGLALATLPFLSREFALRGLPDIGDPFDTRKYGRFEVADRDNAFVDYSVASGMLTRSGRKAEDELNAVLKGDWSKAGRSLKSFLAANKPALDLWRKGTEKPDALYHQPESYTVSTLLPVTQNLRQFARLASARGARLESEGEMREAYGWYRAILRSSRQSGRRGCLIERIVGVALHDFAAERIERWACDPRVDAKMLRQARDDVQAIDRETPTFSDALRVEYYIMANAFRNPRELRVLLQMANASSTGSSGGRVRTADEIVRWISTRFQESRLGTLNEPERSKRVLRLIYANLLTHCDDPPEKRPRKVRPPARFGKDSPPFPNGSNHPTLFETSAADPPQARALPPRDIQKWYETTLYAKALWPAIEAFEKAVERERARQAALATTLSRELDRREHRAEKRKKSSAGVPLPCFPSRLRPL